MNPQKKPHVGGSSGFRFETKMTAFTALRLLQTSDEFLLDSNAKDCGKFDDIVYAALGKDGKWTSYFIQIKHRLDRQIRAEDLRGETSEDFAFHTFFPSFESILKHKPIFNRQVQDKHFVLFTNAPLHINLQNRRREIFPIIFRTSEEDGIKFSVKKDKGLFLKIINKDLLAQFADSFILCPNQCNEAGMGDLILEEIAKIYSGLTTTEIDLATRKWIQFIQEWTESKQILTMPIADQQLREIISQVQIGKKEQMNFLQFIPSFAKKWMETLANEAEQFICITVDAASTQLAMALLQQIGLTTHPNVELSIKDFFGDYLSTNQTAKLVIDCPNELSLCNTDDQLAKRCQAYANRIIFVATSQNTTIGRLVRFLEAKTKPFDCHLGHLTKESRERLLKRNFRFQGHETDLSTIIETELKLVSTSMLTQLCSNLTEIGNELSEEIPFYVPRMLMRTTAVSLGFFNLDTQSRFGLINADKSLFNNPRIVHLKDEREFEKYASDDVPFHMFEATKTRNTYNWRKSTKNVQEITAHLKSEVTSEKRDNILQISENIVVISGKPGMGKSTLLQHLAAATKKYCPNYWIIKVALSDYKAYFLRENLTENVVKELIAAAAGVDSKNKFHTEFFNYCYQSGKMILMLDGFDEVHSISGLVMLEILRRAPLARLWVTTRSTCRAKLEAQLNVLSYTIKPFSKPDQKKFLKQFWKLGDNFDKYIDETLDSVAKSFSEKFQKFTEIPLHTRMIAEVCDPKKPRAKRINAVELFEDFIKLKRQAFVDKFKPIMPEYSLEIVAADHEEKVTSLALLALLPLETCAKLEPPVTDIDGLKKFTADVTSIVLSFHEVPQFIHRTFAEFYAARYFYQHFPTNRDFLTSDQFFDKNFEFVRYFLDRFLAKGCSLHEAIFAHDCKAVDRLLTGGAAVNAVDRGGRTALHTAAGVPDSVSVILALIKAGVDVDRQDRILGWSALQYAMQAELKENWGPLMEHSKSIEEGLVPVLPITWNALLFSIRGDYFKTFLYLLDHGLSGVEDLEALSPRKWINENVEQSLTILHLAAAHNANKILKYLLQRDVRDTKRHLIEKLDKNGLTALLWAAKSGHAESLQILLNAGADIYKKTNDGKTVAIYAVEKHSSDILLTFLADMRKRNMTAVKYLSDVIVKLVQHKSDWAANMFSYLITIYPELISVHSVLNMSLLSAACVMGNERIVKRLLDIGADTKKLTPKGSVLHLAVIAGNPAVVKLLLENNVPVDVADAQGATPAYCAASRGFSEIFFLLVNAGANLQTITVNKDNLAHAAARSPQPDICKFLIRKEIDFHAVNVFSETGLGLLKENKARALVNLLEFKFIPPQVALATGNSKIPPAVATRTAARKFEPVASSTSYVKRDYKASHWVRKDSKASVKTPAS